MAVLFGKRLPPTTKVYFQFKLPGQATSIRLSGQVMWQDWNGRAGVHFVDVPKASRRLLDEYLTANASGGNRRNIADVTVEVEQPWQAAPVATAELSRGGEKITTGVVEVAAPVFSATTEADADNRRQQVRYSCRLGAEVYRTGTSVPNHCCLTDLSSGGCYLEVPLPFPKGSSVEILVRTYEMKLRLRGTVLTSHPGYGMGIGFELKTKEEQANVKKLTDFVAASLSS